MKIKKCLIAVFLSVVLLITFAGCGKGLEPNVKEGRFDFSVTYEVDGELETVSGVFVCEFAEVVKALDGAYIEWNSYIEDTELSNRLDQNRGYLPLKTCDDGVIYLDFCLSAKYFMSDPSFGNTNINTDAAISSISPRLFIEYNETKGEELGKWWSEDVTVLDSYGAKIIGYEYDVPIENIYK